MRVLPRLILVCVSLFSLLHSNLLQALPIGFGRNQGDLEYDELTTNNFMVYHDRRSPHEARVVLEALEAARPRLEKWLGVERGKPLPVILSSTTSNASFANFITDAIELQTLSRGGRDLAWHEYTHSTMYRHLDNILGPAGSLLHLPWMPAWWIEGLAETMSVSSGSDWQYGIERYFALRGGWPTYDKLHSLYDSSRFSQIGYAVSGAFVSYILRTNDPSKLPQVLESFFKYSMPWWWPWTFVPFNGFMPMDEALRDWTGKTGAELYEAYKKDAEDYWRSRSDLDLINESGNSLIVKDPVSAQKSARPGQSMIFNSTYQLQTRGDEIYFLNQDGGDLYEARLEWNNDSSSGFKTTDPLPDGTLGPRVIRKDFQITLTGDNDTNLTPIRSFWYQKDGKRRLLFKRKGFVSELNISSDKFIWLEEFLESQKLCSLPRSELDKPKVNTKTIRCFYHANYPKTLRVIGTRTVPGEDDQDLTTEIWLGLSEETLLGDRHSLAVLGTANQKYTTLPIQGRGKPLAVAFNKQGTWMALADQNHHFIRQIDPFGRCIGEHEVANLVDRIFNSRSDYLVMSFWEANGTSVVRTQNLKVAPGSCRVHDEPLSPLLASMRDPDASLSDILKVRNPWQVPTSAQISYDAQKIANEPVMGNSPAIPEDVKSTPAKWRPRPVFGFPWIGIDALGYQYGMISVPLMDHMQNETLQVTALYGVESRFPNVELNFLSTRFETTFGFDVFRRQTWNGSWPSLDGTHNETYYFDERGAQITAARYIKSLDLGLRVAYKHAWLLPYLGEEWLWDFIAKGYIRETQISLNRTDSFYWATLSTYVNSDLATKTDNKNYDYDQVGGGVSLNVPISLFGRSTYQNWGLNYSRVRGSRRKLLKEVYRPLRTYVPGSGGGLNEINQPLFGPGALTSAKYGDTQARFNFSWTFPVLPDLAKLIHIVYLQRLDFTSFFNYGNAWNYIDPPKLSDSVKAHGYNLDLTADVKGVKLNAGVGVGQVWGNDWEVYALFGFDALIDQGNH